VSKDKKLRDFIRKQAEKELEWLPELIPQELFCRAVENFVLDLVNLSEEYEFLFAFFLTIEENIKAGTLPPMPKELQKRWDKTKEFNTQRIAKMQKDLTTIELTETSRSIH
jgi:hypothetical protein